MRMGPRIERTWIALWAAILLSACSGAPPARAPASGNERRPESADKDFRGRISAGVSHTCMVLEDGRVACWGENPLIEYGFIQGAINQPSPPVILPEVRDIVRISVGLDRLCAVTGEKKVLCLSRTRSGLVEGLQDIEDVSVGWNHACARSREGEVYCWGENESGQIGNGTEVAQHAPVKVEGLENVRQIAVGRNHACALLESGEVSCWGGNEYGQLGDGTETRRSTPTTVIGLSGIVQISADNSNTCALNRSGEVYCWGIDTFTRGQCDCNAKTYSRPTWLSELADVTQVEVGSDHSCALKKSGKVMCWGTNVHHEMGPGVPGQRSLTPIEVADVRDAAALTVGLSHACILRNDATAFCWGANDVAMLGDGTETDYGGALQKVIDPVNAGLQP